MEVMVKPGNGEVKKKPGRPAKAQAVHEEGVMEKYLKMYEENKREDSMRKRELAREKSIESTNLIQFESGGEGTDSEDGDNTIIEMGRGSEEVEELKQEVKRMKKDMDRMNDIIKSMSEEAERQAEKNAKEKEEWLQEKRKLTEKINMMERELKDKKAAENGKIQEGTNRWNLRGVDGTRNNWNRTDQQIEEKRNDNNNNMQQRKKSEHDINKFIRAQKLASSRAPEPIAEEHLRYELKARRERRRSIIVRGDRSMVKNSGRNMWQRASEKLNVNVRKTQVRYENDKVICVEFESLEEKLNAMEKRRNLKGSGIWVDDDHTRREIEIQKWLREKARQERENGQKCSVGYQSLVINEELWKYNEKKGQLEQRPFRERRFIPRGGEGRKHQSDNVEHTRN